MEPLTILLAFLFLGSLGVGIGAWFFLNPTRSAADRVAEITRSEAKATPKTALLSSGKPTWSSKGQVEFSPSRDRAAQAEQTLLQQAGLRSARARGLYKVAQIGLVLLLPFFCWLIFRPRSLQILSLVLVTAACVGYFGLKALVTFLAERRKTALLRPFPDALDLLVSCVEAGLALDASLQRVGEEFEAVSPPLSYELRLVHAEMAAGVPRVEALRHMDERISLQEFSSLVNVVIQADRYGTSIAAALRAHSNLVRNKRILTAEEKAGKVSPKMTVVMILFLFPALFMVILGPATVQIARVLLPALK
jgi:tight adherence protein C